MHSNAIPVWCHSNLTTNIFAFGNFTIQNVIVWLNIDMHVLNRYVYRYNYVCSVVLLSKVQITMIAAEGLVSGVRLCWIKRMKLAKVSPQ